MSREIDDRALIAELVAKARRWLSEQEQFSARQRSNASARRRRPRTSALQLAAREFFEDPDNADLFGEDYSFKEALERFDDHELLKPYSHYTVRSAFARARGDITRTRQTERS